MNELALFAGAGGGILGGLLAGWTTICAVECDAYAAAVLAQRQNDKILAPFPIWSDVCTFDGKPWRGLVDVVSGGFPCQDISVAGTGKGLDGERSGLWREFFRIICEVQPRFAFVENSPALTRRGLARILADIASVGGNARWCVASAADQGAWHKRERLWLVADFGGKRRQEQQSTESEEQKFSNVERSGWWAAEPALVRMVHGLAYRVDRVKALGNGQVPIVAARAWQELTK